MFAGAARFVYNWSIDTMKLYYRERMKTPSFYELRREWNKDKCDVAPWFNQVSKWIPENAIRNCYIAFENFWGGRTGFPRYKKRSKCKKSFKLGDNGCNILRIENERYINLPSIGKVKTKHSTEKLLSRIAQCKCKIYNVTIKEKAPYRWFAVFSVENDRSDLKQKYQAPDNYLCGIDLGLNHFAILDDGTKIDNPRIERNNHRKTRKLQKSFSRKQKGSNNREKARKKLARQYFKIANKRKDFSHKLTTELTRTKSIICVEDLSTKNMLKQKHFARSIQDASWSEFIKQLEYKTEWYGSHLIKVNPYHTTKKCSNCGTVKDMALSQRTYDCDSCDLVLDRDVNAAKNILAGGLSESQNACGESISPDSILARLCEAGTITTEKVGG